MPLARNATSTRQLLTAAQPLIPSPALAISSSHNDRPSPSEQRSTASTYPFLLPYNRVRTVALHIPYFSIQLQARLAYDAGLTRSTLCRLVNGRTQASLPVALRLREVISQRLGRELPLNELFSLDGYYPTRCACVLADCRGCLPPEAYTEDDNLKPQWRGAVPSAWSLAPERSAR